MNSESRDVSKAPAAGAAVVPPRRGDEARWHQLLRNVPPAARDALLRALRAFHTPTP